MTILGYLFVIGLIYTYMYQLRTDNIISTTQRNINKGRREKSLVSSCYIFIIFYPKMHGQGVFIPPGQPRSANDKKKCNMAKAVKYIETFSLK